MACILVVIISSDPRHQKIAQPWSMVTMEGNIGKEVKSSVIEIGKGGIGSGKGSCPFSEEAGIIQCCAVGPYFE